MTRHKAHLTVLTLTAALFPVTAVAQTAPPQQTAPAQTAPTQAAPTQAAPTQAAPNTQLSTAQQATQAAAEARALAAQARATYPQGSATIDQPLWKQAATAADRAAQAAPGNPEILRLRAQIYTEVGFWAAAQDAWTAYFRAAPGAAGGSETKQAALVQYNLGYAAYTRNLPDQSARAFALCLERDPQNAECASWTARVALESGQYTQAQTLYANALKLRPGDKTLTYFQNLAQSAGRYGPAATRAFSRAYAELDAGNKAGALAGFQEAGRSAPNFAEAWREAGRLALEAGNAGAALEAYQGAAALPTASAADRYNLALAQEGAAYGLSAVQTYRKGYAQYTAGDKAGAEAAFLAATAAAPTYAKAWTWLGRVRYEAKNYAGAADAYGKAAQLDPNDKSSAYYLRLAQQGK